MALASELARSVREAVTCSKTLRKTEIAQIEELLPGVHVLAVVVRVGHLAVQTSLGLWQMNEGTARTSINSWPMNGLSSMAISSNTTITRPAE